jgi:hypothetical protein
VIDGGRCSLQPLANDFRDVLHFKLLAASSYLIIIAL